MVAREHGESVGADLIRDVPVRGDSVGADDHQAHLTRGHAGCGGAVDDDAVRDGRPVELPGGQPPALEQRARLVDQHVLDLASCVGAADGAERRAVAAGRERTGVAVGERSRPARAEGPGGVRRHRAAALDLLAMDAAGPLGQECRIGRQRLELRDRPRKVDRGRSRGEETCRRGVEVLAASGCERIPHGGCDADRGSAADREGRDRLRHVAGRATLEPDRLLGQPPLVEQDDPILLEPDDLLGTQVSLCG